MNGYKRINAPVAASGVTWPSNSITLASENRRHMVRIPDAGRSGFRQADGAAKPYLLQAVKLAAGLEGMASNRSAGKRLDIDM